MKTLFKILTPTISTIGIATIALSSCAAKGDGYSAIPKELLKIENKVLVGFQDPTVEIKNYNKLTVPKEVESVKLIYHSDPKELAFNCIKKIDYEANSNWKSITSISNLANLEYLVLPPKLSNWIQDRAIFGCVKLSTIDISNVEDMDCLVDTNWIALDGALYDSGTLIVKKEQASKVETIKTKNPCLKNFKIKEI